MYTNYSKFDYYLPYFEWKKITNKIDEKKKDFLLENKSKEFFKRYSGSDFEYLINEYVLINKEYIDCFYNVINWYFVLKELWNLKRYNVIDYIIDTAYWKSIDTENIHKLLSNNYCDALVYMANRNYEVNLYIIRAILLNDNYDYKIYLKDNKLDIIINNKKYIFNGVLNVALSEPFRNKIIKLLSEGVEDDHIIYDSIYDAIEVVSKYTTIFRYLSYESHLSEDIIDKYKDKLDWDIISKNYSITEEFLNKYESFINKDLVLDNFTIYYDLDIYTIAKYVDRPVQEILIKYITHSPSIFDDYFNSDNVEFINKNLDIVDWDAITHLTLEDTSGIRIFKDKLNWDIISAEIDDSYLTKDFLVKYKHNLNWDILRKRNILYHYINNNILSEREYIEIVLDKNYDLFKQRLELGISYEDCKTMEDDYLLEYNGKKYENTKTLKELIYNISKDNDYNYQYIEKKISRSNKLLDVLNNYNLKEGDYTKYKYINDKLLHYNHFYEYDCIDILKKLMKADISPKNINKAVSMYKNLSYLFTSLPKISKFNTTDNNSKYFNVIDIQISTKALVATGELLKLLNKNKKDIIKFVFYYMCLLDKDIYAVKDYIKVSDYILSTDRIIYIKFGIKGDVIRD